MNHLKGLTDQEVIKRINEFGLNVLKEEERPQFFYLFLAQFKDIMILILLVAAIISLIFGDIVEFIAIISILFLNAFIGAYQELKAHNALKALSKLTTQEVLVYRNSIWKIINTKNLVQGDVAKIETGQIISADMKLLEAYNLECDEAVLTGESIPVLKDPTIIQLQNVYRGVTVVKGRGIGLVISTGENTQMGKIAKLASSVIIPQTPLTTKLNKFAKQLTFWLSIICVIFFIAGLLRNVPVLELIMTTISLAVAAIPEALPAVVSVTLALGAKQMAKHKALVKNLKAVETLGSVDIICTDKTGTLTQNKMKVHHVLNYGSTNELLGIAVLLCEDVEINHLPLVGDPTEVALVEWAIDQNNLKELANQFIRTKEIPFSSELKRMSVLVKSSDEKFIFAKGAPESISDCLFNIDEKNWLLHESKILAEKGQRTIAFAGLNTQSDQIDQKLNLLGIISLVDPIRDEVPLAIQKCHEAGIKVVMITGDHKSTAQSIGKLLNLVNRDSLLIDGNELENLDWENDLQKISIISRANPEHKIKLIEKFLEKDHVVAMTGDGVNDAAALKKAHIGIAMGLKGTDAAKESSDIILLDDNFSTIVNAIAEGRRLYANIIKFIKFLLIGNFSEILVVLFSPLLGLGNPFSAIHILWINLMTDSLPGFALSQGPINEHDLKKKPRKLHSPLLNKLDIISIILIASSIAITCLFTFFWTKKYYPEVATTMTFSVLVFAQLGISLVLADHRTIFRLDFIKNHSLLIFVIIFEIAIHLPIFFIPKIAHFLKSNTLTTNEFFMTALIAVIPAILVEIAKIFKYKSSFELK